MPWLLFVLVLVALGVAFTTTSIAVLVACLLMALVFLVAGVTRLLAQRVESRSRDEGLMLDPAELHRLRGQADAGRSATPGAPHNDVIG